MLRGRQALIRVPMWWLVVVTAIVLARILPLPIKNIIVVVFTAVLLASAVAPLATRLERYHVPRTLSILLAYFFVVAVIAGTIALLVPLVISEIDNLRNKLPAYSDDLNAILNRLTPPGKQPLSTGDLFSTLSGNLSNVAGQLRDLLFRIAGIIVQLLVILVAAYFLAVDPKFAEHIVSRFTPPNRRQRVLTIMRRIGSRLGQWIRAQLVLAVFFGVCFGVSLAILRIPYSITLGVTGGVLEIIPYVGGFTTLMLGILVASTVSIWKVILVVIVYTVVTNVEAHVVAPNVMGRILGLHPLTVVVALFIGEQTLGIIGVLLSVPVAVAIQVLLDELYATDSIDSLDEPGANREAPDDDLRERALR